MPRNERENTTSRRKGPAGSEAKGYGGRKNTSPADKTNFSTPGTKNGSHGYDANRQYRSSESGNYGNWEKGAYDEFDSKFDRDAEHSVDDDKDVDDRQYRVQGQSLAPTTQRQRNQNKNIDNDYGTSDARKGRNKKAGGHHKSTKKVAPKKKASSKAKGRDEEESLSYRERYYGETRNTQPSGYTPNYKMSTHGQSTGDLEIQERNSRRNRNMRSSNDSFSNSDEMNRTSARHNNRNSEDFNKSSRSASTREPAHDHDEFRAQERTRRNFRPETDRQTEEERREERYQSRYAKSEQRQRRPEPQYDDDDRYGYASDRGMYGHYHVRPYNRNEEPEHDRNRGLRNSGRDMMSDYGAGEGRGQFAGRDSGHNYANEFYEDADNERLREARRNYSYRHGYDESDSHDTDDFTPHQTRGVSPGFDEVRSTSTRGASKKAKRSTKSGSKMMAKAKKTATKAKSKKKASKKTRTTKR